MSVDGKPGLERALGFWALTAYGVGDILGAGIYALVGKIAGVAGEQSALAFLVALGVAGLTALSYAELGSRFPHSGGEARFCQQALGRPSFTLFVGWLVFCSGIVSLATVGRVFSGYVVAPFFADGAAPEWVLGVGSVPFLIVLGFVCFNGIRHSSMVNIVCTIVETSGLLIVIVVGLIFLTDNGATAPQTPAATEAIPLLAVIQAGALAFFAFIGFEDIVNVAEEVKSPERNIPRAMLTALAIAGIVYLIVIWIATSIVPPSELAESHAPLLDVVGRAAPWIPPWTYSIIALFAVTNTALLNFVMGSRLLFGMSRQHILPGVLGHVHPRTRTPHYAILTAFVAALILALSGTVTYLAGTTSALLLLVFFCVHLALLVVHRRHEPSPGFKTPRFIPIIGAVTCVGLVPFVPTASMVRASVLIGIGIVIAGVWKWRNRSSRNTAQGTP